jgi:hypothetical protein
VYDVPKQRAFYYVRVLEIPTPRWTACDQVRFGTKMSPEVPMTQQERAWSSPIWYTPQAAPTIRCQAYATSVDASGANPAGLGHYSSTSARPLLYRSGQALDLPAMWKLHRISIGQRV